MTTSAPIDTGELELWVDVDAMLASELDTILPPRFGRSVAADIPNARFEVMPAQAHQPFQEVPNEFNARVDAFWRDV
jgi:pimeloyl-ACP methyl ester carboxylesterase